jgi:hypothetical protein
MMESLTFARAIEMPLNAHLIIHWGGTLAGDGPDGNLFARLRYLLDKRFQRKFCIPITGIWVRERHRNKRTRQQSDVGHSHLLLHVPPRFRVAVRRDVEELVTLIAGPILDDRTIEMTFPHNPDGKYLLKFLRDGDTLLVTKIDRAAALAIIGIGRGMVLRGSEGSAQ